jgi:hypothetical protein
MAGWWERWLGGGRVSPPPVVGGVAPVSAAEDAARLGAMLGGYLNMPNNTPFEMLRVYRHSRDAIPDVSDAVWTWKRLCQTGFDVELHEASSEFAEARARRLIESLDARMNSGDRGVEGLLDIFYASLFTYGAAAFEIVLSRNREQIWDVVPVDVWTVRFRREQGRLQAYQLQEGQPVALPMDRFVYVGLDRDGTNPYGRSMLRSIPFVLKIQQRLLEDMAKATHNAGWPRLHFRYTGEERQRGESAEGYRQRMEACLAELNRRITGLDPDQNLITFDNVVASQVRGEQQSRGFYENHKAVEEQVITGMHLMPILLGRNYGTTETYGTAQFEIISRQVNTVNRSVQRILERLYNFELALMWGQAKARVRMHENRTVDVLREAQARQIEIENVLRLREVGVIGEEEVVRRLRG